MGIAHSIEMVCSHLSILSLIYQFVLERLSVACLTSCKQTNKQTHTHTHTHTHTIKNTLIGFNESNTCKILNGNYEKKKLQKSSSLKA